ncbi:TraM recognition domain-containing protein [Lysinibacillus sp. 1P01SD]|uniref:type IV secretory system conjugative DNA transfer family protein n=1 Tax=Lysinibacillus sp. 1P01SD TaxID=3132285 RepID=UPI0039A33FF8
MTASTAVPYGSPIVWGGSDLFTHMLIIGPTRCGKTSTLLKPMVYQMLKARKMGMPLGLSLVEPKGDVAYMVREMCEVMDIDMTHIDPTREDTGKFNPFEGEEDDVAEATVVVLKGLFGKQDAFFATVQELSARSVTKMLKRLHGDDMDITDVVSTLRDEELMEAQVDELIDRDGLDDLTSFMKTELLGTMRDKYRQFVIGLRAQLENLSSNKALQRVMLGKSSISIDNHFETGGILSVNTALGMLRSSGDAFGQFVIMHLQNGTFRRKGTESTRVPHFMIVDEYSRYINPDVEIFLSLAAEYRVAGIFATQSLGQLEIEAGKIGAKAMKRAILASCRNKICFGGVTYEDAKDFADVFGKDKIIMRQNTYKNTVIMPTLFPDSYRDTEVEEYRFAPTDLQDNIPRFNFVHQLMKEGVVQKPSIGRGEFVPQDWKDKREWEQGFAKAVKSNTTRDKENEREIFGLVRKFWHGFTAKSETVENKATASEPMNPLQEARSRRGGNDFSHMTEQAKYEFDVNELENNRPHNAKQRGLVDVNGNNLTSLNMNPTLDQSSYVANHEESSFVMEKQPIKENQVTSNSIHDENDGLTTQQIAEIESMRSRLGDSVASAMKDAIMQENALKQKKQQDQIVREQDYLQQQQEETDKHLHEDAHLNHSISDYEGSGDAYDTKAIAPMQEEQSSFKFNLSEEEMSNPIATASSSSENNGEINFKKKSRSKKSQDGNSTVKAPIVEGLNTAIEGNTANNQQGNKTKNTNRSFVKNDGDDDSHEHENKNEKAIRNNTQKKRDNFW